MEPSTRRSPSTLNPLAEPFTSTIPPTPLPPPPPPPSSSSAEAPTYDPANELIYHNLSTYPFAADTEFQSGLSAILGHPERRASPDEVEHNADLVLKAQCFYFARQNNLTSPIDPASYKSWLASRDRSGDPQSAPRADERNPSLAPPPPPRTEEDDEEPSQLLQSSQAHESAQSQQPSLPTDPPPPDPRYPTTFNHIVDLITRNQPIPGIETIPNIVLGTQHAAPNTVPARRKPWETAQAPPPPPPPPAGDLPYHADAPLDDTGRSPVKSAEGGPAVEKPLGGGLWGPLERTAGADDVVKPIPVPTTTPSWQELAEEGGASQAVRDGDTPAAHAA